VALALAIELPVQATTMRPPGTSMMLLLVDEVGVGDTGGDGLPLGGGDVVAVPDAETDTETETVGETDGDGEGDTETDVDPVGVGDGVVVGVGVVDPPVTTAPPTALPALQVNTYSVPVGVTTVLGVTNG
jgi:hypothetical protein